MATMSVPDSGIKVRMYNTGFGDCLLLAFRGNNGKARYMLIDFGVHHEYCPDRVHHEYCPDRENRMKLIAEDIALATDKKIHVVAITHEHTDHLYGFKYGRENFDQIELESLWLSWAEDKNNAAAKRLKEVFGMKAKIIEATFNLVNFRDDNVAKRLSNVISSMPDFDFSTSFPAYGGNADQLDYLRQKAKNKPVDQHDYLHPKIDPLTIEGVDGVKVYVLGPPEEEKWIRRKESKTELYPEDAEMSEEIAFSAAVFVGAKQKDETDESFWRSRPFEDGYKIAEDKAMDHRKYKRFFKKYYGFSEDNEDGAKWRRIDSDWLNISELMALDLRRNRNNTSLVLAIELTNTTPRKVLLFAADAELGNWLSWYTHDWEGAGANGETIKVEHLLGRTVFYKVGHHGSHNATLSRKGLELMNSPELIAFIPVDSKWADESQGWTHPAVNVLKALKRKTDDRVFRTDKIPPKKPDEWSTDKWNKFVRDSKLKWDTSGNKLWIECTISE